MTITPASKQIKENEEGEEKWCLCKKNHQKQTTVSTISQEIQKRTCYTKKEKNQSLTPSGVNLIEDNEEKIKNTLKNKALELTFPHDMFMGNSMGNANQ